MVDVNINKKSSFKISQQILSLEPFQKFLLEKNRPCNFKASNISSYKYENTLFM